MQVKGLRVGSYSVHETDGTNRRLSKLLTMSAIEYNRIYQEDGEACIILS
jgi:hypothetical protein